MTKSEYIALYEEYSKTDSISKRKEIEEKIAKNALALFNRVRGIYDRYQARDVLIDDDDYRDDRGWIGLAHECGEPLFERDSILLHYSDRWAYGGECSFGIRIYTKWFDVEERKNLAEELRKKLIAKIEAENVNIEASIDNSHKRLEKNLKELEALKAEVFNEEKDVD